MSRAHDLKDAESLTLAALTSIRATKGNGNSFRSVLEHIIITCLDFANKKGVLKRKRYKDLLSNLHTDITLRMAAMDMPEAFDVNETEP